jgi:eukaryotic-like serine/threonine-protein kinase
LLVLFGSAGIFFYTTQQNQSSITVQNNATATALANSANVTSTAQAIALATARASGAATQQANIQATQNANGIATAQVNATATAQVNIQATAQANANATAAAQANPDPYPPYTGTLALYEPLSNNNLGYNWKTYSDSLSSCAFTNNAFHVTETKNTFFADCDSTLYFSNFAYEVQMQIVQGDCEGIIFRADSTISQFYFFRICQDGSYALLRYVDNTNAHAQTLVHEGSNASVVE